MGRRRRKNSNQDSHAAPAPKLTPEFAQRFEEWAEEAAEAYGLVVFDVKALPNWLLTVYVDREGAPDPGKGVAVDDLASVSRYLEAYLDADESVWDQYTIEVSSPGVERKLTRPRHYELSVGRDVRIVLHEALDKQNVIEGRLEAFENDVAVVIEKKQKQKYELDLNNIAKARLTYDFSE